MGIISVSLPSDGQTIDAVDYNVPINTIVDEINGNIDSNNIANNSITNAMLNTATGELGAAWKSFTPAWTNLSVSGGESEASYMQIGKTVHFKVKFIFTGSNVVSGTITLTLPVTRKTGFDGTIGNVVMIDANGSTFTGFIDGTGAITCQTASGTYATRTNTSSTVPFTWANLDQLLISGTYEAA